MIRIRLTDAQIHQLRRLNDQATRAAENDRPGALVAQIDGDLLTCTFADHEVAKHWLFMMGIDATEALNE
jgi:hypothetical protein